MTEKESTERFEGMIPFILHFEVGLNRKYLSLPPEQAYQKATQMPKAFAIVKGDRGGATMCGVTLSTYAAYRRKRGIATTTAADLREMPYVQWRDILKGMFWDRWQADKIKDRWVAYALVDFAWHSGVHGIKIPQRIVGVKPDGIVGTKTLAAVNGFDPQELFARIKMARLEFLNSIVRRDPSQGRFLKGWYNRVNALEYGGFHYE